MHVSRPLSQLVFLFCSHQGQRLNGHEQSGSLGPALASDPPTNGKGGALLDRHAPHRAFPEPRNLRCFDPAFSKRRVCFKVFDVEIAS